MIIISDKLNAFQYTWQYPNSCGLFKTTFFKIAISFLLRYDELFNGIFDITPLIPLISKPEIQRYIDLVDTFSSFAIAGLLIPSLNRATAFSRILSKTGALPLVRMARSLG